MYTQKELIDMLDKAYEISTKPDSSKFNRYGESHIEDEDKSVKWNREFVQKSNEAYSNEVKRLRNYREAEIKKVTDEIIKYIADYAGIPESSAAKIYSIAYDDSHSDGAYAIITKAEEYADLVESVLKDMRDKHMAI